MNWFKQKLRDALGGDSSLEESSDERLVRVEEQVRSLAGTPSEEEQDDITFAFVRSVLKDPVATRGWLAWVERVGLVVRGAQVRCPNCTSRGWRALAELAPPIVCRGCGAVVDRPYDYDQVKFRYRGSELLLRLVKDDVIVHALTFRYFMELFGSSFNEVGPIFGAYPGVTVREPGVANPIGEADVLFAMIDGRVGVGECKASGGGLLPAEMEKLDRLATALDASWTFTATVDRSAACGALWRTSPTGGRLPHYALTAEHLYDFIPMNVPGTEPLSWRESYLSLGSRDPMSDEAHRQEFVAVLRRMEENRDTWQLPWWRHDP
jgi:hypothetical protein